MNYIDIIIVIPLLWGAYKGYTKGFIIEAASIAALLLGIYGAIHFSVYTSELLIDNFNIGSKYLPLISFALTFILIVIAVHFVARLVNKLIKAVALNFVNRIAGAVFGVAKFALIISIILNLLNKFDNKSEFIKEDMRKNSLLYKPVSKLSGIIFPGLENIDIKPPFNLSD